MFFALVLMLLISYQQFEPAKKEKAEGGKNPFTVENFQKAIKNLNATNPNGRAEVCYERLSPSTTRSYLQFNPQNEDRAIRLHNTGYDLYETPTRLLTFITNKKVLLLFRLCLHNALRLK